MTYKPTQTEIDEIDNIFNEIFAIFNGEPDLIVDLSNATLSGADLSHADLSGADLSGIVDLTGSADLSGADLRYADLSGIDEKTTKKE